MKRFVAFSVALVMVLGLGAAGAFAAQPARGGGVGLTVDGSLAIATETYSGSDAALGFGFGLSYDLSDAMRLSGKRLLARADFNSYQASAEYAFLSLESSRMPLFVGARYILPARTSPLDLYAEAGVEFSFDEHEEYIGFYKYKVDKTNVGVSPGFGVIFPIGGNMSLGANVRAHIISNSYVSFNFTFGYTF